MELSPQAFEFAHLILTHYQTPSKVPPTQETLPNPESPNSQPVDTKTKYSMDYKKFEEVSKTEEGKSPSDAEDPFKTNPYLAQMGCSHDRRKERELYEKPTKEKLDDADFFKSEGNKAYREGDLQKSSYFYQKALLQFDYTFTDTEEEEKRLNSLKEACHTNLALVKYLLKDNDEVLTQVFQALKLNPRNIKALFRKALVHYDRDLFDETHKIIDQILKIEQKEAETLKLLESLKKKEEEYRMKAKLVSQKMFKE